MYKRPGEAACRRLITQPFDYYIDGAAAAELFILP